MPLELTPLASEQLSPVVGRVVGPGAQGPAKMMAARGLVPMGPRDLVTVLYQLSCDAEPKIVEAAKTTAAGLPDNILSAALADALDVRVLHFYAALVASRPQLAERILLNRATDDETFLYLASVGAESELEILATNQERLLRCPAIIEALYFNRQARMSTVDRLLEMAVRNGITLERIPHFKEIAASILGSAGAGEPAEAERLDPSMLDSTFNSAMADAWDEGPVGELELGEGEAAAPTEKTKNISQLPLAAKIRLATIGSASHRSILIRDSNRSVAMSAAKSPAVSEQEATRWAANRSLQEEIIRYIAGKKEWQKSYQIKVALVNNPKCPLPTAMHLLQHLRQNDLKMVVRSKNVPSALSKAAKELLRKKGP